MNLIRDDHCVKPIPTLSRIDTVLVPAPRVYVKHLTVRSLGVNLLAQLSDHTKEIFPDGSVVADILGRTITALAADGVGPALCPQCGGDLHVSTRDRDCRGHCTTCEQRGQ
jgi:hypothetical protein